MLPNRLVLMDIRGGAARDIARPAGNRTTPRFSPSGDRITYAAVSNRNVEKDIHILDLATGNDARLTFAGDNFDPIWSTSAREILRGWHDRSALRHRAKLVCGVEGPHVEVERLSTRPGP